MPTDKFPPVLASIKSDLSIFNPKIRQVYATGDAAVIAVSAPLKEAKEALKYLDPFPGQDDTSLPNDDNRPEKNSEARRSSCSSAPPR
jgi:hypothetical protein